MDSKGRLRINFTVIDSKQHQILEDFSGHWFPWFEWVMRKAADLPVSARVLRLPCLQSSSRKMPGCVFSLSAWDVHGATISVSRVQYLKQPQSDRWQAAEMRRRVSQPVSEEQVRRNYIRTLLLWYFWEIWARIPTNLQSLTWDWEVTSSLSRSVEEVVVILGSRVSL